MPRRHRRRVVSEINIVPYIDVMLVLLVIFMITAPLIAQGVKVELPQAKAEPIAAESKEPLIVSVDADGLYYFNGSKTPNHPLKADDLVTAIAAQLRLAPSRPVFVNGDNAVNYGKVVQAMVLLQHSGVESVGLMTKDPSE